MAFKSVERTDAVGKTSETERTIVDVAISRISCVDLAVLRENLAQPKLNFLDRARSIESQMKLILPEYGEIADSCVANTPQIHVLMPELPIKQLYFAENKLQAAKFDENDSDRYRSLICANLSASKAIIGQPYDLRMLEEATLVKVDAMILLADMVREKKITLMQVKMDLDVQE